MSRQKKRATNRRRYRFFFSPYEEHAFTRCPKCEAKTRIRKFPLVIHIEPRQLFLLNKKCRFCTRCRILIVKKSEVEAWMVESFRERAPELIGNDYLVLGTLDRKDWLQSHRGEIDSVETVKRTYLFRDEVEVKVIPGGWYREGEHPLERIERGEDPESVFPPEENP